MPFHGLALDRLLNSVDRVSPPPSPTVNAWSDAARAAAAESRRKGRKRAALLDGASGRALRASNKISPGMTYSAERPLAAAMANWAKHDRDFDRAAELHETAAQTHEYWAGRGVGRQRPAHVAAAEAHRQAAAENRVLSRSYPGRQDDPMSRAAHAESDAARTGEWVARNDYGHGRRGLEAFDEAAARYGAAAVAHGVAGDKAEEEGDAGGVLHHRYHEALMRREQESMRGQVKSLRQFQKAAGTPDATAPRPAPVVNMTRAEGLKLVETDDMSRAAERESAAVVHKFPGHPAAREQAAREHESAALAHSVAADKHAGDLGNPHGEAYHRARAAGHEATAAYLRSDTHRDRYGAFRLHPDWDADPNPPPAAHRLPQVLGRDGGVDVRDEVAAADERAVHHVRGVVPDLRVTHIGLSSRDDDPHSADLTGETDTPYHEVRKQILAAGYRPEYGKGEPGEYFVHPDRRQSITAGSDDGTIMPARRTAAGGFGSSLAYHRWPNHDPPTPPASHSGA